MLSAKSFNSNLSQAFIDGDDCSEHLSLYLPDESKSGNGSPNETLSPLPMVESALPLPSLLLKELSFKGRNMLDMQGLLAPISEISESASAQPSQRGIHCDDLPAGDADGGGGVPGITSGSASTRLSEVGRLSEGARASMVAAAAARGSKFANVDVDSTVTSAYSPPAPMLKTFKRMSGRKPVPALATTSSLASSTGAVSPSDMQRAKDTDKSSPRSQGSQESQGTSSPRLPKYQEDMFMADLAAMPEENLRKWRHLAEQLYLPFELVRFVVEFKVRECLNE
jgi:hypothetical protein